MSRKTISMILFIQLYSFIEFTFCEAFKSLLEFFPLFRSSISSFGHLYLIVILIAVDGKTVRVYAGLSRASSAIHSLSN